MDQTNLLAAQKVESRVIEILDTAPSVAIYYYSDARKTWEKSEHEGALLLCRCGGKPEYCFIILNQLKPQNFIQHLDNGVLLQRKQEYLMYKIPAADTVRSIWFYNPADCERIFSAVSKVVGQVKQAEPKKAAPQSSSATSVSSKPAVKGASHGHGQDAKMGKDILSMLSTAHKNYDPRAVVAGQGQDSGAGGGGGIRVVQPATVGAGGDARPLQQSSSSSIPLENLFKSCNAPRNGAPQPIDHRKASTSDVQVQEKEQPSSIHGAGLSGVNMISGVTIGKGRGRPLSNDTVTAAPIPVVLPPQVPISAPGPQPMAPFLQRLFMPGSAGGDQQQQPVASAFTNVAPRQNQRAGSIGSGNGIPLDSFAAMQLGSPLASGLGAASPLMESQRSPGYCVVNEGGDVELLTPADLGGAIRGNDVAVFNRAMNAAFPFSPPGSVSNQSQVQGISPPSATSMIGQPVAHTGGVVEQFRQCFIRLLEDNQDFVQRLYDAFVQETARRTPGFGPGAGEAWRKN